MLAFGNWSTDLDPERGGPAPGRLSLSSRLIADSAFIGQLQDAVKARLTFKPERVRDRDMGVGWATDVLTRG